MYLNIKLHHHTKTHSGCDSISVEDFSFSIRVDDFFRTRKTLQSCSDYHTYTEAAVDITDLPRYSVHSLGDVRSTTELNDSTKG